jgi:two-component system sensor histidine kinase DctS
LLNRDTRKRHQTEAQLAREIIQQRKSEEVSRQSLDRLQKSARLATLGEMASMMSHELNQPLAAITSYASGSLNLLATAEQGKVDPADIAQITMALERITAQSERAGSVIKSVHNFVRRRETDHAFVAPQSLFDSVLPLVNLQAKQIDIKVQIVSAKDLPLVWCDKTLIEQVLINLARNGMQAMGQQPVGKRQLTLRAQLLTIQGERLVEFSIQDTGTGLTAEVAERLFTPFFTTKSEGMGLGLSLCRTVIEQHGSSLAYTTVIEPSDTGTIFSFKLKTERYANIL